MKFYDPERKLIGDRPCWANYSSVIPDVVIEVSREAQKFHARVMLPTYHGTYSFSWAETEPLGLTDIARLLIDWHDDPEKAVQTWWHHSEPDSSRVAEGRTSQKAVAKIIVPVGDVDVDDLGL